MPGHIPCQLSGNKRNLASRYLLGPGSFLEDNAQISAQPVEELENRARLGLDVSG